MRPSHTPVSLIFLLSHSKRTDLGSSSQDPWLSLWAPNPQAQWDKATEC